MSQNLFFDTYCGENVILNFEGALHVFMEGVTFGSSSETFSKGEKTCVRKETEQGAEITITNQDTGIEVCQHYAFFGDVIRQYNEVRNCGEEERVLTHASSAKLEIPYEGQLPWNDDRRFRLHVCKNAWSTEAQWQKGSLTDFGLVPFRWLEQGSVGKVMISGKGSWATSVYYPIFILEDLEQNETYFMEHEGGLSWEMTLGVSGDRLVFHSSSANVHLDGFHKRLGKGENFVTTPAVYGKVTGGFDEAVRALTKYKRAVSKRSWEKGLPMVCYNVFMGAIYAKPNEKNLKRLIPAAAAIGCEVFCIDAGWFKEPWSGGWKGGDYEPYDEVFGEKGVAGMLALIRENGMLPGLWFEFEAGGAKSKCASTVKDAMLTRNGTVISAERGFFDLTKPEVRENLFAKVDYAYKLGMRYIKNDYNYSTGIGTGDHLSVYNENERKRDKAIRDFIDELYRRYPDIIIENCGSGGMREDNGTLSHFHVQSTSDQELYFNYASIAAASNALMPPEKAGNWANPYFLGEEEFEAFDNGENIEVVTERNRDGEATIFSMMNGMAGVPFVSGRIDYMDELNFALAKEAVDCYKEMRADIATSYAVYPTGTELIGKRAYITMGLIDEEKTQMYLFVWKVNPYEDEVMIDLSKYAGNHASVAQIYPKEDEKCSFTYAEGIRKLTVKMEGSRYMARLYKVEL